jgi:hypothetical protein
MNNKKVAHIFNLDNLMLITYPKVWVIDSRKPNKCIVKISKTQYDLIKSNRYKGYGLSIKQNDQNIYLDEYLYEILKEYDGQFLRFSFRELIDPIDNNVRYRFDLSPLDFVDKKPGDIIFVSTKGLTDNYGELFDKLKYLIKKKGYNIKKLYHLNQSFFAQNTDENLQKISYTLISNITGKKIKEGKIVGPSDNKYNEVLFYDSNYNTIEKLQYQLPEFMKFLECYNKELLENIKVIKCNSNRLKKFTEFRILEGHEKN